MVQWTLGYMSLLYKVSKSERERQTLCINAYVWNLERWYWWTYLQESDGDANIENRFVDTVEEREGGTNWKRNTETYILPSVKAVAPHSSTLSWKVPWTEEPGGLQSMGLLRLGHDWATSLTCIGEGNGNPLQCLCLENPIEKGAWRDIVHGVAKNGT